MKEYVINNKTYRLNLFNSINDVNAYLLGYLTGDGGYQKSTYKRVGRLFVSSIDKYIIDFFQKEYCPDNIIHSKIPVNKKRNIISKKYSHVLNFSSLFSPIFNKHGILCLKKDRKCLNIPKKFMKSYIHGIIDSDGHFSWGRRKDRDRLWINVGITHQSLILLKTIQKYLSEELNISSYINPRSDENCMDLKFSKITDVVIFIEWLYNTSLTTYNYKKHNKVILFMKEYSTSL